MRFSARIFSFLIPLFFGLFLLAPKTQAYVPTNNNPDVPRNLHTYTQSYLIEMLSAVACQLGGVDPVNPDAKCLGVDQDTGKIGFVENGGGAVAVMGNVIGMTFQIPVHTSDYVAYLGDSFGIAKKSYARTDEFGGSTSGRDVRLNQNAPTGFQMLSPVQGVWSSFRDLVYLIFVLVFTFVGLGIMMRVKIDPRTVMTIQNQIPRIIIGILLVTFSYAIAGFLIDMMYATIYIGSSVIASSELRNGQKLDPALATKVISASNPIEAADLIGRGGTGTGTSSTLSGLRDITDLPADAVGSFVAPMFDGPGGRLIVGAVAGLLTRHLAKNVSGWFSAIGGVAGGLIGFFAGGGVGAAPGAAVGVKIGDFVGKLAGGLGLVAGAAGAIAAPKLVGGIASLIVQIILMVAVLSALFRLWFSLLQSYLFILFDIVFAPFWIVGGILPGRSISFQGWIKDLLANLSAFPVTIFLFLLGKLFVEGFSAEGQNFFVPPMIANRMNGAEIGGIIGLAIILTTPNVVNITKQLFKAPKLETGTALKGLAAGAAFPANIAKEVSGIYYGQKEYYVSNYSKSGGAEYGRRSPLSVFGRRRMGS